MLFSIGNYFKINSTQGTDSSALLKPGFESRLLKVTNIPYTPTCTHACRLGVKFEKHFRTVHKLRYVQD